MSDMMIVEIGPATVNAPSPDGLPVHGWQVEDWEHYAYGPVCATLNEAERRMIALRRCGRPRD